MSIAEVIQSASVELFAQTGNGCHVATVSGSTVHELDYGFRVTSPDGRAVVLESFGDCERWAREDYTRRANESLVRLGRSRRVTSARFAALERE